MRARDFAVRQTVYTINAQTNQIEKWFVFGAIPTKEGVKICLRNDRGQSLFLPENCVFDSKEKALAVLNKTE